MNKKSYLITGYKLAKIYFTSSHKYIGGGLLFIIISLSLANVYLLVKLNKWSNTFYSALQEYNTDVIFSALGDFSLLAGCYILVNVYSFYLEQVLEIKWRTYLTEHFIARWLQNRTYYLMQLMQKQTDNPDQRISEDIRLFTNITLGLGTGLVRATGTFIAFVVILWNLSGARQIPYLNITVNGYLVYVALIYATLGTVFAHVIGRKLVKLNYIQQQFEANFRYSMVRFRENAENIAFYRGEMGEQKNFMSYFNDVIKNFWQILTKRKHLTWYNSIYSQIAIIFPYLVVMPRYLSKEINLGGLMQIASAFGRVQDSLSFFVNAYSSIAEWQAVIDRLAGFEQDINATNKLDNTQITRLHNNNSSLELEKITVLLPNEQVLIDNLQLKINTGEHLLIKGESGKGKSTLMRTIAGLWSFGSGTVHIAPSEQVLFLPQRTYLPLGSLRTAVLYPSNEPLPDSLIKLALEKVSLGYLIEQLDTTADWSRILSLGEQQRIAIARVLLLKPQWVFLDEATSALDSNLESIAYSAISAIPNITIISVAHKPTLQQFHQQELLLLGEGKWSLNSNKNQ